MKIILNGQPTKIHTYISYDQVIEAAGYQKGAIVSVIYYWKSKNGNCDGILSPGQKIPYRTNMVFNAIITGNA